MTDEQDRALRDFARASSRVKESKAMKSGGSAAEKEYSQTYQMLVRLGLAQQIKAKYR